MLLSIIVPVFNVERYIAKCLQSILIQYDTNVEIILVDDASIDGSIDVAERILLAHHSQVNYKIFRNPTNKGVSYVRNKGIEEASGDYIYFVDSDDEIEHGAIVHLMNAIQEYPIAPIFIFNASYKNPEDTEFHIWRDAGTLEREIDARKFISLFFEEKVGAYLWQYLFKKSVFEHVKFKEGVVWEDAIVLAELLMHTKTVISYDNLFIYKYILRKGSITQGVHATIDAVIPAFDELEKKMFSSEKLISATHGQFIEYRSTMLMRLSRECFTRCRSYKRLMQIHKRWGGAIPLTNIRYLWSVGKKRSSLFLVIVKYSPSVLYALYRVKLLK